MESVDFFLRRCVVIDGSDLHFKTDTGKAYIRVHGDLHEVEAPEFNHDEFRNALFHILSKSQIDKFERDLELDFAYVTFRLRFVLFRMKFSLWLTFICRRPVTTLLNVRVA